MSIEFKNKIDLLSQALSKLSVNEKEIKISENQKPNLYMGIGLWSVKGGLSNGLPVDVMHMLLSAALLRAAVMECNPGVQSRVFILIADSMAVNEGADVEEVKKVVALYTKSLGALLPLLNLEASIVLSSELMQLELYQNTCGEVMQSEQMQNIEDDRVHYAYILQQTAITHFMQKDENVGIKVGWSCQKSQSVWDERKFDAIYSEIFPDSAIQFFYTKSGLKQLIEKRNTNVIEGCPYTAFSGDNRYVIGEKNNSIREICPIKRSVARHWISAAEICFQLKKEGLFSEKILSENCIQPRNRIGTVFFLLNYWVHCDVTTMV